MKSEEGTDRVTERQRVGGREKDKDHDYKRKGQ